MTDDAVRNELEQMAGNRRLAEELRWSLEKLRGGTAGSELAEMADDVLAGRIALRDVAHSAAYAAPILQAMEQFMAYQAALSDDDRTKLIDEAADQLDGRP
ncbi:hypothetical protein AB0F81_45375 [Actinoplanes sp. NPDC024001]|uniref:hypothetical protein n=1 Tax=Actinoplanes sp. NPDC024001 TaxID=3154598 RepID=UPI00340729CA